MSAFASEGANMQPASRRWIVTSANCRLPGINGLEEFAATMLFDQVRLSDSAGTHKPMSALAELTRLLSEPVAPVVLCCADDAVGMESVQQLLFLATTEAVVYPSVHRFAGAGALAVALAKLPELACNHAGIVIISAEPVRLEQDDSSAFDFAFIVLSEQHEQPAMATVTSAVLEGLSAGLSGNDSFLFKEDTYPWRAVGAVVASGLLPEPALDLVRRTTGGSNGSLDADYTKRTGMPLSARESDLEFITSPQCGSSESLSDVVGMICAVLTVHQKLFPCWGKPHSTSGSKEDSRLARPWIHPVSPVEPMQPRRVLFVNTGARGIVLEECDQGLDQSYCSFIRKRDCELFFFAAADLDSLIHTLDKWQRLACQDGSSVAELAYWNWLELPTRSQAHSTTNFSKGVRLALVVDDTSDLASKISLVLSEIGRWRVESTSLKHLQSRGIYFSNGDHAGDLAFVLPGLGAAYPGMLMDLCIHFPEVRQVFDFVDRLALKSGATTVPSKLFFPTSRSAGATNVALLATMDSAVVSVILAEWALFRLLSDLGVSPNCILGCSTGEFASLAMNGCIDIVEAAGMFYRLSTAVARSVPLESLANLKSICVAASWSQISPLAINLSEPVYLSAEMTARYAITSGPRVAIDELGRRLQSAGIDFYPLPVAIPYHTPLVADKVSAQHDEVRRLDMRLPSLPTWTCSKSALLPEDLEELRLWSTGLFEKPIQFKSTIEKMYASGVRTFVEVGPKGALVPLISDVLKEHDHLALPVNVATRSGLAQLLHLNGALFCAGVDVDPGALYRHRFPVCESSSGAIAFLTDCGSEVPHLNDERRSIECYPAGDFRFADYAGDGAGVAGPLDFPHSEHVLPGEVDFQGVAASLERVYASDCETDTEPVLMLEESNTSFGVELGELLPYGSDAEALSVFSSFMESLTTFQDQFIASQETVMLEYLAQRRVGSHVDDDRVTFNRASATLGFEFDQTIAEKRLVARSYPRAADFPFIKTDHRLGFELGPESCDCSVPAQNESSAFSIFDRGDYRTSAGSDCVLFPISFDLNRDLFLLDHAIGGITRTLESTAGYGPAPARVYLVPLMVTLEVLCEAAVAVMPGVVSEIRNVRAYKRIVIEPDCSLELGVRVRNIDRLQKQVLVEIVSIEAGETEGFASQDGLVYVQAEVFIAQLYTQASSADRPLLEPSRRLSDSKFSTGALYGPAAMFHGPRMQSVLQLSTGNRFQSGIIKSRSADDWFCDVKNPRFLIDPLLLDNASQLVLYQMYEAGIPAMALLPFHIDSIKFFADLQQFHGANLHAAAKLNALSERGTRADIEICTMDGAVLVRVSEINSRAIMLPPVAAEFVQAPNTVQLSFPCHGQADRAESTVGVLPVVPESQDGSAAIIRLADASSVSVDDTAVLWLTDYILHPQEKAHLPARAGLELRRLEWILGRVAAKDAVRTYLHDRYGLNLCAADIVILSSPRGVPVVSVPSLDLPIELPLVSIAHSEGRALAVASPGPQQPGVDIEYVTARDDGFKQIAFTVGERALLAKLPGEAQDAGVAAMWTAKECVAKSTGQGLKRVDFVVVQEMRLPSLTESGLASVLVSDSGVLQNVSLWLVDGSIVAVC